MPKNFNQVQVDNYDLDLTLSGGQTFVWEKINETWYGKTIDGLILLKQPLKNIIEWQTFPIENNFNLVFKYLRIDFNYSDLISKSSNDIQFIKSLSKYNGMRLLNQNPYETIISYIISANNSYKNIQNSIKKLSLMFGEKIKYEGQTFYLFPKIEKLSLAALTDLKSASVGYRAEYILETSKALAENKLDIPINAKNINEDEIREKLLKLKGVGNKVADCVLSFGFAFDNIAPVDVWVRRVFTNYYNLDPKLSYKDLRKWSKENMHGYASWISQYLFEYIRSESK